MQPEICVWKITGKWYSVIYPNFLVFQLLIMHVSGNGGHVAVEVDNRDVGSGIDRVCNCRKPGAIFLRLCLRALLVFYWFLYKIININI